MSQRIWKFPLDLRATVNAMVDIEMPSGSRIINLAIQQNIPHIWAIVDPSKPRMVRHFAICGTGHEIPDDGFYHGSLEMVIHGTSYIWHVFETES